jgi:hypothetical protein
VPTVTTVVSVKPGIGRRLGYHARSAGDSRCYSTILLPKWFRIPMQDPYRRPRTGKGAALRILERLGNFRDVVVGVLSRPHETSEESPARSRRPGRLRHSESSNRGGPRKMVPAPTIQAATPPSEKSRLHGSPGANPAPVSSPIPLRLSSARPNRPPIQRYSHPV